MLLLNKECIQEIFSMKEAIEANKLAFSIFSSGESCIPLRTNIKIAKQEGVTLFMPGYVENQAALGVKIISIFPNNYLKAYPSVSATMILINEETGKVCCIMDGTYLTQMRTGAAAGAATDILARKDSTVGALFGIGGQAPSQLEAMLTVRNLNKIFIYSRNFQRTKNFVNEIQVKLAKFKTNFIAAKSPDEAIIDADIITTATTSKQAVFDGNKIKKGVHINAIGSFTPDMQEIDEKIIRRADKIYFDSQEAVLMESGDFIIPFKNGLVNNNNFIGELGQVINNIKKARESKEEITVFKSVGIAAQDIITGAFIYKKALKEKKGQTFLFD